MGALFVGVLVAICLSIAAGHEAGEQSPVSGDPQPRTIDEVLMRASGGRASSRSASLEPEILDGMDMMLTQDQHDALYSKQQTRSAHKTFSTPWTNGVIPYEIKQGDFDGDKVRWIHRAMTNWEAVTCVNFRPATHSDSNKIQIHTGSGCWAHLGMKGGSQQVNLDPNCFWRGTIEHELGHTLGLIHEHQRPQRDGYVKANYYAVKRSLIDAVTKYARGSDDKMGLHYDYHSIMHYGKRAFSSNGYTQVFYPRDPVMTDVIGMILKPSFLDAKLVNLIYKCGDHCSNTCPSNCFVDGNCHCKCEQDFRETCEDTDPSCPRRARDGDCNENTIFMHTQCRLSCGICNNNGSEAHLLCANSDSRCDQWAHSGECSRNPNYMHRSCPKACGDCHPGDRYTIDGPCRDQRDSAHCQQLTRQGQCDKDPEHMLKNCRKSCDFCPQDLGKDPSNQPGCHDFDTVCEFRAENGLCQKYYALMSEDCRQACGNCDNSHHIPSSCTDTDTRCRGWAYSGECDTNPGFMLNQCQFSCSTCPGLNKPDNCMDYDTQCSGWSENGECDFNPTWMNNNCRKSCGVCVEPGHTAKPKVCKDWDSRCAGWAASGECESNPRWMPFHCKMSCGKCPGHPVELTTPKPGCHDDNASCGGWANYGECNRNPGYMLKHCKLSCNVC